MNPVLVLGCGSIGRRHIANLGRLGEAVVGYDPDPERRAWAEKHLGCPTVAGVEEGLARRPRAVWICSPPNQHAALALRALAARVPCFVEKPLAHCARDAGSILRAAGRVPVAVGYQLRFHPGLRWLKARLERRPWGRLLFVRAEQGQFLPDWRPGQDYRDNYTARRRMGGGILLDASHEVDLLRWLVGEVDSVFCLSARLSGLEIDAEDTAELVLRFRSGAMGAVHLDMVQRAYRRNLELAFERGTVLWDLPTAQMSVYEARTKRWTRRAFPLDLNELYVREARAFLAHLGRPGTDGLAAASDGARTLAVVEAAKRSCRTRRMERVS